MKDKFVFKKEIFNGENEINLSFKNHCWEIKKNSNWLKLERFQRLVHLPAPTTTFINMFQLLKGLFNV